MHLHTHTCTDAPTHTYRSHTHHPTHTCTHTYTHTHTPCIPSNLRGENTLNLVLGEGFNYTGKLEEGLYTAWNTGWNRYSQIMWNTGQKLS